MSPQPQPSQAAAEELADLRSQVRIAESQSRKLGEELAAVEQALRATTVLPGGEKLIIQSLDDELLIPRHRAPRMIRVLGHALLHAHNGAGWPSDRQPEKGLMAPAGIQHRCGGASSQAGSIPHRLR